MQDNLTFHCFTFPIITYGSMTGLFNKLELDRLAFSQVGGCFLRKNLKNPWITEMFIKIK